MKFELVDPGEEPEASPVEHDVPPTSSDTPADPAAALALSTARLVAEARDTATLIGDSVNGFAELLARSRPSELQAAGPPVNFRPALFRGDDEEGA